MERDLISQLKKKLLKDKEELERILSSFAVADKKLKGDWDTKFPQFNGKLEESTDEVEEYTTLLPIEARLELRLLDINRALEKIKRRKNYGICEKCGGTIKKKRMKIVPETKSCSKCTGQE